MNLDTLHNKLIAAARLQTPGDEVPYAFEKRIMARLAERAPGVPGESWIHSLWRAAACSAALALLVSLWTLLPVRGKSSSADLSQDFEKTVFAMVDEVNETW